MNRIFKNLSVARPFICAAAFALIALAPRLSAMPIQWSDAGEGQHFVGNYNPDRAVYIVTIFNYGDSDADNMISQTVSTQNGQPLTITGVFVNNNSVSYVPTATGFSINHPVASGYYDDGDYIRGGSYTLEIHLQPGCNPGRLRLSAMAGNLGGDPIPFNDLIIGPPYAQPSLALARLAPPGPGTNAVDLAISSDAEFLQLQYTDTLSPTNWNDLARVAVTGAVTLVTDTNVAPSRFYRAVVPVP